MSASAKKKLRKEETAAQLTEKQLQAQKESKKLKLYTTIFVVAIAVILVAGLVIAGTTMYKNSGIREKNTVAAVIGDYEINSVEMSYYYSDAIQSNYQDWSSTYGDALSLYMSLMGLDITQPLSQQTYSDGVTWADYFVDIALNSAKSSHVLYELAVAEGFTMTEDTKATLEDTMDLMPTYALLYGYDDADSYLRAMYGPGATMETYRAYAEKTALASDYYNAFIDAQDIDDAAIRAYEADHYNEYSSFSYANYTVSYSHFLTGGTTDEDGNTTYTEEEKDAARAAAKAAAEAMPQSSTVEELNAAIAALPENSSSLTECTTYEDVLYSTLNTNVCDWMGDSSRKVGDYTLVANESTTTDENGEQTTTISGYTAYVFLGRNDNTEPLANIRHILVEFEGGTEDENGNITYSEEEKAAALKQAEDLLELYKAGGETEDVFAELATANTDDLASSPSGGLYEDITPQQGVYVESFTNWAIDPNRVAGETGIIESEYGYHVMYYVGDDELTYRDSMIRDEILDTTVSEWYDGIMASSEITEMDTSLLNKDVILSQS